jgi:hypothetical protein
VGDARIEDFYDVPPPMVRLVGGINAGRRMFVPEPLPFTLLVPFPEPSIEERLRSWSVTGPPPIRPLTERAEVYRLTGRIDDDGARVYEWSSLGPGHDQRHRGRRSRLRQNPDGNRPRARPESLHRGDDIDASLGVHLEQGVADEVEVAPLGGLFSQVGAARCAAPPVA